MPTNTRLSLYIAFIVALAVWTGGGTVVLLALLTCSLVGLIRLVRPRAAGTVG